MLQQQWQQGESRRSRSYEESASKSIRSIRDGVFTPNERIRALQYVLQAATGIELSCNKCGKKLVASWMYERHGKTWVLVPSHGHSICGGLFVPSAGMLWKRDVIGDLVLCHHGLIARECWRCGGSKTCIHRKQRYKCKICRSSRKAERGQP
eukprot:TRINITY_DN14344_c0_g2_i1.p1 TRINITY_DN14344_c0_g2~~TRINITY_DN14344_c0_g2_i1.p1  ORF type:complete len:152 (+),score=23.19 TRINITY_DN14344_c0_g2_i1:414-869(+)